MSTETLKIILNLEKICIVFCDIAYCVSDKIWIFYLFVTSKKCYNGLTKKLWTNTHNAWSQIVVECIGLKCLNSSIKWKHFTNCWWILTVVLKPLFWNKLSWALAWAPTCGVKLSKTPCILEIVYRIFCLMINSRPERYSK